MKVKRLLNEFNTRSSKITKRWWSYTETEKQHVLDMRQERSTWISTWNVLYNQITIANNTWIYGKYGIPAEQLEPVSIEF